MPDAQKMINRVDLVNPPQWADEGNNSTPSNYAKVLAGGGTTTWTAPMQRGKMSKTLDNTFVENLFAGTLQKQGKFKTREQNSINVSGRIINTTASLGLFTWGFNAASAQKGPSNSRTWLYSYRDAKPGATGDLIYNVAKGAKPQSCRFSISKDEVAMVDLGMACKDYYEGLAADTVSNDAAFTAAPTNLKTNETDAVPIRFQDLGDFVFYNYDTMAAASASAANNFKSVQGTNIPFRSFEATAEWGLRRQDSNGSDKDLFVDYASQSVTGQIDAFKYGHALNETARTDNLYSAFLELEKPTSTNKDEWAKKELTANAKKLTFYSVLPGTIGHNINMTIKDPANGAKLGVTVQGKDIVIQLKETSSTFTQIAEAVNNNKFARRLIFASHASGDASQAVTSGFAKGALTGGVDNISKLIFERFAFEPSNEDLIDQSEATIESKSFMSDVARAVIV